jgi:hypothetical protein
MATQDGISGGSKGSAFAGTADQQGHVMFLSNLNGQRLRSVDFEQAQYHSLSPSYESLTVPCIHLGFDDYALSISNPVRLSKSLILKDQSQAGFEDALRGLINLSIRHVEYEDGKSLSLDFDGTSIVIVLSECDYSGPEALVMKELGGDGIWVI